MHRALLLLSVLASTGLVGCIASGDEAEAEGEDEREGEVALSRGINGDSCAKSPYNCKLRVEGGNRVLTNDEGDKNVWALYTGFPIRNGHGDVVGTSNRTGTTFNFGQVREFAGEKYAFAVSTSNGSAGWMPLASIKGSDSFAGKVSHVSAKGVGLKELGCYEVRNSHEASMELKKVVFDSKVEHERAGDYLALLRNNGQRSANLTFNVPGFGLGGVAVDHFPAGTKFRRLDVPTSTGAPSIDIPLWVADSAGRYRKKSGEMKFIYGYVMARTGTKRVGWMAYDALRTSAGCP